MIDVPRRCFLAERQRLTIAKGLEGRGPNEGLFAVVLHLMVVVDNEKLKFCTWSWNYRGRWHQTCPPIEPTVLLT
jgi:hypothetical protein